MSKLNHPNVHAVELMLRIQASLKQTLRGGGAMLTIEDQFDIAKAVAEKAEELIDKLAETK